MNDKEMSIPKSFSVGNTKVYLKENTDIDYLDTSNQKNILDIYKKGLKNISSLSKDELELFYLIDNVKFINNKTLIIGYMNNYIQSIKNTLYNLKLDCNVLSLEKNIELYLDTDKNNEFEAVFQNIKKKIISGKYDKFVLDITNLCLYDYTKTKKLLNYLESTKKEILIIIPENRNKFKRIFGEKYIDKVIEKKYIVHCGSDQTIKNKIMKILY